MDNHIGGSLNLTSRKLTLSNFTRGQIQPSWGEIEPNIRKPGNNLLNVAWSKIAKISQKTDFKPLR